MTQEVTTRHAYLIMAYNNWRQLGMLLELLDDSRNDIYIHIDKRAGDFPQAELAAAVKCSRVTFIPRKNVFWADYSQTDVELDLLEAASRRERYHYYHLLSGMCLPLRTQDELHAFFENEDREFIATVCDGGEYSKKYIAYYHPLLHNRFYRGNKLLKAADRAIMHIQRVLGLSRLKHSGIVPACGWNWFSVTDDFCRYLVGSRPLIRKIFRHTVASDEHVMGTMAVNSVFVNRIYDINDDVKNDYRPGCQRFVDWQRGRPYVWGSQTPEADYQTLMTSGYLFARKFDERVNYELIRRIYDTLMERQSAVRS